MSRKVHVLKDNDALSMLIDIWMDGFVSGSASTVSTLAPDHEDAADAFAVSMAEKLRGDPLAIETVRREITERMTGKDDGETKTLTIPGGTR